jgi:hypothetical protein
MVYVLLVLALLVPQRPTKVIAAEIIKLAEELLVAETVVVPADGNLQAALNEGGIIEFEGTHTAPDRFVASVPGTRLIGRPGAKLVGGVREAIIIPPGAYDIELANFEAVSNGIQSVVRVGANDTSQTTLAQEPYDITLRYVRVPTHRGKRGIEINARDVLVEDCEVHDTWSSALVDSQGIAIYNASGNITVRGGTYEAGSENVLVGGDTNKMGVTVTNVRFEYVTLRKPLSWKTDGVNRVVKNLFELKTGRYVTLQNSTLDGSWHAAQAGHAIVITPTLDGQITEITIQDNTIRNVGNALQILGRAYSYYTPTRVGLTFQRNNVTVDHLTFGGSGRLAEISAEPDYIRILDNQISVSGSSFVTYYWGNVMLADGTKRPGGPMNSFVMTGNTASVRPYGLNFLGYINCGPTQQGFAAATVLNVTGNTFSNSASLFRTNFPGNTYP